MSVLDLIVRAATAPDGRELDVAIDDGRIVALAPALDERAREELDARGLHVLPGAIDAHVHFNEPGRTEWEGFATGTRALAAGGTTLAFEMPLSAHPPTLDGASFDLKRRCAEASALVDFALWGGLVPGPVERLDELAERGVVGFKAFMCDTAIDDFAMADDLTLYEGMARAAALGLIVAVHAESEAITSAGAARAKAEGRRGVRDYLGSRPVVAEVEAIGRAIALAEATGCALHLVHVSCGRGVALVADARARGVDVSCETCPHYLVLCEDDVEALGAVAKCAPPLRAGPERDALWSALLEGSVPMVASDHSPAPSALKEREDFFAAWGGIAGCQTLLALLLSEGHHRRGVALERVAELVSGYVARRFELPAKGRLDVGADADLVLVDLDDEWTLAAGELRHRHRQSPWIGRRLRGRVVRTLVRGTSVYAGGEIVAPPVGRLVTPERAKMHA